MVLMSSGVLCRSIARLIDINTYILKLTMDIQDTSITIHKINPKEATRHMDILEVLNELIL